MNSLQKSNRHVRPRLWVLSPVIFYIVVGFIVLNICFGFSLWYMPNRALVIVENSIFTHYFWGVVFWILAAGLMLGLWLRSNHIVRIFLIGGLTVKFVWWAAFIALVFQAPTLSLGLEENIAALGFWFFISMVQAVAIMLFPPTEVEIRREIVNRLASEAANGK